MPNVRVRMKVGRERSNSSYSNPNGEHEFLFDIRRTNSGFTRTFWQAVPSLLVAETLEKPVVHESAEALVVACTWSVTHSVIYRQSQAAHQIGA